MKFKDRAKNSNLGINITPLIDIVFILLIFFAVTTSFIASNAIKVDLPEAKGEAVEQNTNIRVAINSEGVIYVDGQPFDDPDLKTRLQIMKESNPDAIVIIEADELSTHGKLVFVIDTARSVDFMRFAIATEER